MFISSPPLPFLRRLFVTVLFGAVALAPSRAATLSFDATLHIQPHASSPVVGHVTAGTSITLLSRQQLAAVGLDLPPPGWVAVQSSGPFEGFVQNSHVQEDGRIAAGAEVRLQPLPDAPLLLVVEEGDDATAREPLGDWSRATIRTDLYVYAYALPPQSRSQGTPPPVSNAPAATAAAHDPMPAAVEDEPVQREKPKPRKPKRVREEKVEPVPVETGGAPRNFTGYLQRTRRFLGRGPKYDYQLVDADGRRIALLDVSSLLATSPVERFENRRVSIYGPGLSRPDVKDVIIRVQTMRLNE